MIWFGAPKIVKNPYERAVLSIFDIKNKLRETKKEETNILIENLLSIAFIKPYLKEIIYKKSEGNPLFIEEIILSRVDNLPLMEKIVLQRASIIGRNFWDIILQELVQRPVFYYLQNLEKLDFIRHKGESGIFLGIEYIFKHYLIRETIYRNIIEEMKKKMHSKVAEILEKIILPEHIKEYYKMLAYHFEKGEIWKKCAHYYFENGKILKNKSLFYEALEDLKKAKEISDKYNVMGDKKFEINLNLAEVLSRVGEKEEAINIYNEAFNKALLIRSWLYYLTGALSFAIKDLNNVFEIINREEIKEEEKNSFLINIYNRYAVYKEVKSKRMLNFGKCDLVLLKINQKKFDEAENLIKEIFSYAVSAPLRELIYRSYVLKIILLWEKYKEEPQKLEEIFEIEKEAKKFEKNVFNFIYTLKLKEKLYMASKKINRESEKYYEDYKNLIK